MKVLVLASNTSPVAQILHNGGIEVMEWSWPLDIHFLENNRIEFIVSHGYRHIIGQPVLDYLPGRIINLHISYLPWNRGADPNLWSFLEDTPKGVSIHFMDHGIDAGDIIAQKEVAFRGNAETLFSTYETLQKNIITLFQEVWPSITDRSCKRLKQPQGGSFHKTSDKEEYSHLLINGWETPVNLLKGKAILS